MPSFPGMTFDREKAFSREELARDALLPGAREALVALQEGEDAWQVTVLTARAFPQAFHATVAWFSLRTFDAVCVFFRGVTVTS